MTAPTALPRLARDLQSRRVAVIGDVMLDHFLVGHVDRISPEAPVPVICFDHDEYRLGGAANVAHNITSLGGRAAVVGLVGEDPWAGDLRRRLQAHGIGTSGVVADPGRPTTRKMRIVTSRNQQVARVDHETDREPEGPALDALVQQVTAAAEDADAIVISDYRKGVVSPAVIAAARAAAAARQVPLLVDPKLADVERYRGATLITPNHREAEVMTRAVIRTSEDARAAARRLHEQTGASVIITWGELGMWVFDGSAETTVEEALPALAREVADVTGAGDTVIAVLALALAAGARLADAARLANIAAGLVVGRFGPATVTAEQLAAASAS